MAVNFVDEFQKNTHRGFTASTIDIFSKLKHTHFKDILYPAKEILREDLDDNGCAMYIAPIALVCVNNSELNLIDEINKATAITHLHENAVNGAILYATAIQNIIRIRNDLNVDNFLEQMLSNCAESSQFMEQIQQLKKLLNVENPSEERVVNVLGHSTKALYSVPTAMYCFLRTVKYPSEVRYFLYSQIT